MDRDELSSPPEEFSPPPEEFPFPGARVTPPPEEFPLPAEAPESAPGRRRRRLLFYLAAALLLLLLAGRLRPVTEALPPTQAPFDEPTAEPSPTAAPAPSPEASPSPAPEPTPAPTAVPEPECQILFFNFSSSNYVRLFFTRPEAFRSVELSLTEPILDLPVASLTLGPEEIAAGELELPAFATDELYFAHMDEYQAKGTWPEELALHAVLSYEKDGMPVTEVRDLTASPELGWNLSYWPRDTEKYDWNFPGFFRFETYESEMPAALVLDIPPRSNTTPGRRPTASPVWRWAIPSSMPASSSPSQTGRRKAAGSTLPWCSTWSTMTGSSSLNGIWIIPRRTTAPCKAC